MSKFTNPHYRKFIDEGVIEPIGEEEIKHALQNIKGKNSQEGRALLITLYLTGARPNEVLRLKSRDIETERTYLIIKVPGSKGGLPRPIYLKRKNPLCKELEAYSKGLFPDLDLFHHYQSQYRREKNGKEIHEISAKLRYYFTKWFDFMNGIPPYFLRHNRFSKLSQAGLSAEEIRILKGGKSLESVMPYLHLSTKTAKKIAKKIE